MYHLPDHAPGWHALEETRERAWLDDWARLHHTPTPEPEPAPDDPAPALTTAGSPR